MKFTIVAAALAASAVNAHSIFQKVSVNGAEQALQNGIRGPNSNNPTYDVTSPNMACNAQGFTSNSVISVNPGDKIGTWWQHVIGGPQFAGDHDNPIASSHHGPIQVYLAKVDNAASASSSGQKWFKIALDGFDTGSKKWGVDNMVAGNGWWYFNLPTCLAPGDYLARVELLALHNGYSSEGDQFYMSCAQLRVGGSGYWDGTGATTLSFPGTYSQSDPGILINIYGAAGAPDNGGKPYTAPGGPVQTCPANTGSTGGSTGNNGGSPPAATTTKSKKAKTTTTTKSKKASATTAPAATQPSSAPAAGQTLWGQCGPAGSWTGPTTCSSGTCKVINNYYSQCAN